MGRITRHLSYANVAASLALFVALGGISWAAVALPRNGGRTHHGGTDGERWCDGGFGDPAGGLPRD
jgi:hypothetical protein